MSSIVLFDDKKDCCGCGACMNVCPKNAIRMAEDEVGFVYPEIDQNLCIGCGACKKACGYQMQPMMQKSEAVYAAASNDDNLLRKSASGGAFAVLAENVLKKGGVVYGAALPLENGKLEPKHLRIDTVERLTELQGSKYVQSAIGDTYAQAKKDLLDSLIDDLSIYMQSTGRKYADHAATLRSWSARKKRQQKPGAGIPDYTYNKEESL